MGHLEYDSRKYELEDGPEGCTRIIEYKHFLRGKSETTVIAREYPQE